MLVGLLGIRGTSKIVLGVRDNYERQCFNVEIRDNPDHNNNSFRENNSFGNFNHFAYGVFQASY